MHRYYIQADTFCNQIRRSQRFTVLYWNRPTPHGSSSADPPESYAPSMKFNTAACLLAVVGKEVAVWHVKMFFILWTRRSKDAQGM